MADVGDIDAGKARTRKPEALDELRAGHVTNATMGDEQVNIAQAGRELDGRAAVVGVAVTVPIHPKR